MAFQIYPRGFSNTVLFTPDSLGLQWRVLDEGAERVRFECHYGLWGGLIEDTDSHDPFIAARRELLEEIEGFTPAQLSSLCPEGVFLIPLPYRLDQEGTGYKHHCNDLIEQGYTHQVNWIYSLRVTNHKEFSALEGELHWVPHQEVEKSRTSFPFVKGYDSVLRKVVYGQPTTLYWGRDLGELATELADRGESLPSSFAPYLTPIARPEQITDLFSLDERRLA